MEKTKKNEVKKDKSWLTILGVVIAFIIIFIYSVDSGIITTIRDNLHTIDATNGTITVVSNDTNTIIDENGEPITSVDPLEDEVESTEVLFLNGFDFSTTYKSGFLGLGRSNFTYSSDNFMNFFIYSNGFAEVKIFDYLNTLTVSNNSSLIDFTSDLYFLNSVSRVAYNLNNSVLVKNVSVNLLKSGAKDTQESVGVVTDFNNYNSIIYVKDIDGNLFALELKNNMTMTEFVTLQMKGLSLYFASDTDYPTNVCYNANLNLSDYFNIYSVNYYKPYDDSSITFDGDFSYLGANLLKDIEFTLIENKTLVCPFSYNKINQIYGADSFVTSGNLNLNY